MKKNTSKTIKATCQQNKNSNKIQKLERKVKKGGKSGSKALSRIIKKGYHKVNYPSPTDYLRGEQKKLNISPQKLVRVTKYYEFCEALCLNPENYTEGLLREPTKYLGDTKKLNAFWDKATELSKGGTVKPKHITEASLWLEQYSLVKSFSKEEKKPYRRILHYFEHIKPENKKALAKLLLSKA